MDTLQALIFDVDGTLADTEYGHLQAFNAAFKEHNLDWNWSEELYIKLLAVTGGKERMNYYLDKFHDGPREARFDDAFIAQLHRDKTRHYVELLASGGLPLRPGVRRLLEEAKARGLRLAIATTTTPANVTALLENSLAADGCDWFEVIGAGDVVKAKKPAADIYHYVLEKLNLSAAACLAFEDSENGLSAARDAGLQTVVTKNAYTDDHDFSGASLLLDQLGEAEQAAQCLGGTQANCWQAPCVTVDMLHCIKNSAA